MTAPQRQRCEVWTRVMGYHRPLSHFNTGKRSEHYSRVHYDEKTSARSAALVADNRAFIAENGK